MERTALTSLLSPGRRRLCPQHQKHEAGRLRGFLCCHAPYLVEGSQGICGSTSWMADGLLRLRRSSKKLSMVGLGGDGGGGAVEVVGGEGCDGVVLGKGAGRP